MKTLTWCTDIHLDFLHGDPNRSVLREFIQPLADSADGFVITGDLTISSLLPLHLQALDKLGKPVYFVLGNHDFYGGSFEDVRQEVIEVCSQSANLRYLTAEEKPISITPDTALVGADGFYDGGYGQPYRSGILMSDWIKIHDFSLTGAITPAHEGFNVNMNIVLDVARRQAQSSADHVHQLASEAASTHELVMIVTHVPPFPELHVHGGKGSTPHGVPWYTSRMMGEALLDLARKHPDTRFEVLCGHTHSASSGQPTNNMRCHVGHSEYGSPRPTGQLRVP